MHSVYELWLWIMQLILLRNPDFHHGLLDRQLKAQLSAILRT